MDLSTLRNYLWYTSVMHVSNPPKMQIHFLNLGVSLPNVVIGHSISPLSLKLINTLGHLKSSLKTYLYTKCFKD